MRTIRLVRGDTLNTAWILSDSSNAPISLTGITCRWQLRNSVKQLLLSASNADSRLVVTPNQGRIDLNIPYTDTQNLPVGSYKFDLEVTYPTGRRKTYETGNLVVVEDISYD